MKFLVSTGLFTSKPHPLLKSRALLQSELRAAAREVGVELTPDELPRAVEALRLEMDYSVPERGFRVEIL